MAPFVLCVIPSPALELLLLIADEDERRFRRAAVRWASRYCSEVPDVEPVEAQAVMGSWSCWEVRGVRGRRVRWRG